MNKEASNKNNNLKDFSKTLKENTSAIITALVVLLVVLYYMMSIVPNNRRDADKYNRFRLKEFEKQLLLTFKDYANQIDTSKFNYDYLKKEYLDAKDCKYANQLKKFIDGFNLKRKEYNNNLLNHVLIHNIAIDSITLSNNCFTIWRCITFSLFDKLKRKNKSTLIDFISVQKSEIQNRIQGAVTFPYWMVYLNKNYNIKNANQDGIFLNNQIEWQEFDSLKLNNSREEFTTFQFSDKRFYKCLSNVPGTEISFILVGAENNSEFESDARRMDVLVSVIGFAIILLLFFCIPLIKPIVSSATEKLSQFDLISTCIFSGLSFIVIAITGTSFYANKLQIKELDQYLTTYNQDFSKAFQTELYSHKLVFDSVQKAPIYKNPSQHVPLKAFKDSFPAYIKVKNSCQKYKVPDIIFNLDEQGFMTKEICSNDTFSLLKNYSDREYFSKINNGTYDYILSAVFSKINNKYLLVYAQESPNKGVDVFAYSPSAMDTFKLNQGYGYLICDKEGKVILHNEKSKSLNENIFNLSKKSTDILKMLRGKDSSYFDLDYNGNPFRCFAKKFNYLNSNTMSAAPLYFLTFKDLNYENNLLVHLSFNGAMLSFAYAIGIAIMLLLYSVFFYHGHLSVFSKYHVYWLFPDKSRKYEFKFLTKLNLSVAAFLLILIFYWAKCTFFLSLLIGINLAFVNFVLLTQRVFIFTKPSRQKTISLSLLSLIIVVQIIVVVFFYNKAQSTYSFLISIILHLSYLSFLKRKTISPFTESANASIAKNKQTVYDIYMLSNIAFNYVLIPILIIFSLFRNEIHKVRDYNISSLNQNIQGNAGLWNTEDNDITELTKMNVPSIQVLLNVSFSQLKASNGENPLCTRVFDSDSRNLLIYFICFLIVLFILIKITITTYSSRFFFFELSEIYRLYYSAFNHRFVNHNKVLPPFSFNDLKQLEYSELHSAPQPNFLSPTDITNSIASKHKVIELILSESIRINYLEYSKIWHDLSEMEKFVIHDFAADYFVNYRNRDILLQLIKKGLIIADSVTGRLRLLNYSFRQFVIEYEVKDPNFSSQEMETKIKGAFARWKWPLLIIGSSLLLLLVYMFKENYEKILFYGGSVISTMALMAKFLNNYKK